MALHSTYLNVLNYISFSSTMWHIKHISVHQMPLNNWFECHHLIAFKTHKYYVWTLTTCMWIMAMMTTTTTMLSKGMWFFDYTQYILMTVNKLEISIDHSIDVGCTCNLLWILQNDKVGRKNCTNATNEHILNVATKPYH